MKIKFDNIDDVRAKLLSTFCYYNDKAVYIKAIDQAQDMGDGKIDFNLACYPVGGSSSDRFVIKLSDKKFRCSDYNLGYANFANGSAAVYYSRIPTRQYRQGLIASQLRTTMSDPQFGNDSQFSSNKPIREMLENKYPNYDAVCKELSEGNWRIRAFHRDFALTWNRVHGDYIVEYKGTQVGHTVGTKEFKLMPDFKHLHEALMEAVG